MNFNFSKIESDRVTLRLLTNNDVHNMLLYRNDKNISKYQGFEPNYTEQSMIDFINTYSTNNIKTNKWFQIGIEYKKDKIVIGDCGIHIENIGGNFYQAQIGITLNSNFHGKGIATETINMLIDFLFNKWNLHRIYVEIDARNDKSINLFKNLKFRKEALLIKNYFFKNEWTDTVIYAILKDEFSGFNFSIFV